MASLREYKLSTRFLRKVFLLIFIPWWIRMILLANASGLPIPYMQDTEATMMISRLPDKSDDVALSLNLSTSSLI